NCFELVKNYKEENNSLKGIVQTMIAPNSVLTDQQTSVLDRVIDEEWEKYGHKLTIDIIEKALREKAEKELDGDQRVIDMATQLYAFTSKGSHGKFFNGKNNITFNSNFTVLELEELSSRPALRKVVLLQLIFQIQQAVFLSKDRSEKKIVMIDEGWDLLKEGQSVKFMEHAYRKFRKYNGSMIIATQSLNDLYSSNEAGKAIAENSAFYFLLHQKPETIEQVKEEKRLDLSESGYHWLKSVYTQAGAFSEIFVKSGAGNGIGRLIVSDFQKLLYSTDPVDVQAINNYVNNGYTYTQAINCVLLDRGLYHDFSPKSGQDPHISESEAREFDPGMKYSEKELTQLRNLCISQAVADYKNQIYLSAIKQLEADGLNEETQEKQQEVLKELGLRVLHSDVPTEVTEAGIKNFNELLSLKELMHETKENEDELEERKDA
ncbi:MAG: ATP-binding protein, partial [Succinivibrio dextrinosolvens]|nr:ATP-binding protein [Succinivibrio dextrinosolvens]